MDEKIEIPDSIIVQALRDAGEASALITGQPAMDFDKFKLAALACRLLSHYVLGTRGPNGFVGPADGQRITEIVGDYLEKVGVLKKKTKEQMEDPFKGNWKKPK